MTHWDRVSYPLKSIVNQNEHFDQRSTRPKEDIKVQKTLNGHEENKHLTLLVTGNRQSESWTNVAAKSDFFLFKGYINAVLGRLGLD